MQYIKKKSQLLFFKKSEVFIFFSSIHMQFPIIFCKFKQNLSELQPIKWQWAYIFAWKRQILPQLWNLWKRKLWLLIPLQLNLKWHVIHSWPNIFVIFFFLLPHSYFYFPLQISMNVLNQQQISVIKNMEYVQIPHLVIPVVVKQGIRVMDLPAQVSTKGSF